tara:strand:- start:4494 stop:4766 length:273 start_codon:yes stop_codon:yes gene_type:complete
MRIGELQSLPRQLIEMRRLNLAPLSAVTFHIPNAEIIREDEDNVWPLRAPQTTCHEQQDYPKTHAACLADRNVLSIQSSRGDAEARRKPN